MILHKRVVFGCLLFIAGALASLTYVSHASAIALNPDPGASAIPTYHRNYLESADSQPFSPTITQWLSPANQSGSTSMTVPYGTQTVILAIHYAGEVGWQQSSTTDSQLNITEVSQGVDGGLVGQAVSFTLYPNQNVPGSFAQGAISFQYTNPTPFTSSTHVDISIKAKTVNKFIRSNGTFYYRCVANNTDTADMSGDSCPETPMVFGIDIVVDSIQANVEQANCRAISGWALDMAQPGNSIPVHVYVGGPAGSGAPGYAFTAGDPRDDVNRAYGISGNHGFNFTKFGGQSIESIARNGPVTFYIYAIGQNDIDLIGAPTISACPPVVTYDGLQVNATGVCRLTGWAFDNSLPSQSLYLDVWIGPPLPPNSARTAVPSRHFYKADTPRPDVNNAYGITGNHGFVIDVPDQYRDGKPHSVEIWAYGIDTDGSENDMNTKASGTPVNFVCPILPVCGNLTSAPDPPQPGQSFTIQANAQTSANAPPPNGLTYTINVNIPGIYSGSLTPQGVIPPGSTLSSPPQLNSPAIPGKGLGQYKGGLPGGNAYTITLSNGQVKDCPGEVDITAKPYYTVTQGDIASGFNGGSLNCPGTANNWAANTGRLTGWYTDHGASTTLAALALSQIQEVASAQGTSPPKGLTFGNTTGSFGGSYSGSLSCPKDYYSKANGPTVPGFITGIPANDAQASTNIVLLGGTRNGAVGGGPRSVLFVKGDVYISDDIKLNNSAVHNPKDLANFYLVATGNIYIAPNVKQLDGVYIAQGNVHSGNPTGKIYTCARQLDPTTFAPPTATMMNTSTTGGCRQYPLTVNGAFIADKVNLYRTMGTLSDNTQAETFNYTPSVWLAPPASIANLFTGSDGSTSSDGYDAITTLQPVL